MALGLLVADNFSPKKYTMAFPENTVYREHSVLILKLQRFQTLLLSKDSKLFHIFHTCSKFSLFSFVF